MKLVLGQFGEVALAGLMEVLRCRDDMTVVASAVDAASLGAEVRRLGPDAVIVDDPSGQDEDAVAGLRVVAASTAVLVLAHRPAPLYAESLVAEGLSGCISHDAPISELVAAIRAVASGKEVLPSRPLGQRHAELTNASPLTPREHEVLHLIRQNLSNAEIAATLFIGIETARTHVARVLRKTGARSRWELRALARDHQP